MREDVMGIRQATRAYEAWLRRRLPLIGADLRLKHQRMAESAFGFLRATFYRWAQIWPRVCPDLVRAPAVLGVGDLHVENFGTWRDAEGRLIWGVNDFDEACMLPYANDLVRLAVSAQLASREDHLSCGLETVCDAILGGYEESLRAGGRAFVLAEHHEWLRQVAMSELRDPIRYWAKLGRLRTVSSGVPAQIRAALRQALPDPDLAFRVVHRQAGLGSLGRRRFTALAEWRGGMIAREAKELRVSAWHWERECEPDNGPEIEDRLYYAEITRKAVRVADPFSGIDGHWLVRRLAPDCSRVELDSLPKVKDESKLLHAMGWETANVHLGTPAALKKIRRDLANKPARWLPEAADAMAKATIGDWNEWK
ncbi:MAG: DUF2252 family protein [Limisphaerales bacterium]